MKRMIQWVQERWPWFVWWHRTVDIKGRPWVIWFVMGLDSVYQNTPAFKAIKHTTRWSLRDWWTLQKRELVKALVKWAEEESEKPDNVLGDGVPVGGRLGRV